VYLAKTRILHWVATVPAFFMTVVVVTFIANAPIGFNLPMNLSTSIGIGAGVVALIAFLWRVKKISIPIEPVPEQP
jgi:cytochrome b561